MINEVRGFIRIIDGSSGVIAPVSAILPIVTDPGLYVRVVSMPSTPISIKNLDVAPITQGITAYDVNTIQHLQANGQIALTETPTIGSVASFAFSSYDAIRIQVSGIWSGTMLTELSVDGGITWYSVKINQLDRFDTPFSSFTQNFLGSLNVSGVTNFRVRTEDIDFAGMATVLIVETINPKNDVNLLGVSPVLVTNIPKVQNVQDVNAVDLLWMIYDEIKARNEEEGIFSESNI